MGIQIEVEHLAATPIGETVTCKARVINTDGTGFLQVTDTPNLSESDPDWSPDGLFLVFSRFDTVESGVLPAQTPDNHNLYVQDLSLLVPDQSDNDILEPGDEIKDPPQAVVDDEAGTVTVIMKSFSSFDLTDELATHIKRRPPQNAAKQCRSLQSRLQFMR